MSPSRASSTKYHKILTLNLIKHYKHYKINRVSFNYKHHIINTHLIVKNQNTKLHSTNTRDYIRSIRNWLLYVFIHLLLSAAIFATLFAIFVNVYMYLILILCFVSDFVFNSSTTHNNQYILQSWIYTYIKHTNKQISIHAVLL